MQSPSPTNQLTKVLLFGGTFDPVHNGHLEIARFMANRLAVGRTIFIPAAQPPHKNDVFYSPFQYRIRMLRLAIGNDNLFDVSDCELNRPGPSYTLDTVKHFRQQLHKHTKLYWLIGADTLAQLHTWHKPAQLIQLCTIVTALRPSCPDYTTADLSVLKPVLNDQQIQQLRTHIYPSPLINISSTNIRQRIRQGQTIDNLTPAPVVHFIKQNKLYLQK